MAAEMVGKSVGMKAVLMVGLMAAMMVELMVVKRVA